MIAAGARVGGLPTRPGRIRRWQVARVFVMLHRWLGCCLACAAHLHTPTGIGAWRGCAGVDLWAGIRVWYAVVANWRRRTAAVVQLSVPVIAIIAGL